MLLDRNKLPESVRLWLEEEAQKEQQYLLLQAKQEEEYRKRVQAMDAMFAHQRREEDSIQHFMEESDAFYFDPKGKIPIQVLYDLYSEWCAEERLTPKALRIFSGYLKENATEYHILPTNFRWQGAHIRGFRGMRLMQK